jgi:hypothetical protein
MMSSSKQSKHQPSKENLISDKNQILLGVIYKVISLRKEKKKNLLPLSRLKMNSHRTRKQIQLTKQGWIVEITIILQILRLMPIRPHWLNLKMYVKSFLITNLLQENYMKNNY